MPWVRIDENAMDHPKIGGLSDGCFRLWVQGLAYCQKYLTDGLISDVAVRGLRAYSPKRRAVLGTVGLWEPAPSGIQVHDYLQWNESRAHVMHVRQLARDRIQKLRGKKKERERNAVTPSERDANALRSASGGVVCISSSGSEVTEKGAGKTISDRAGDFCEWYGEAHSRILGDGYIGNPQKDDAACLRLCEVYRDDELRDAATIWFGMENDFTRTGNRTIPKFASRVAECMRMAREVPA